MNVSKATAINSVKDDPDDGENSAVNNKENVTKSNNNPAQLSGNPTTGTADQSDYENENYSVGLCFWTVFQAVGLACVATIICRSVIYRKGYFEASSDYSTRLVSITVAQYSNWHYSLTTIGFIYLYANTMLMLQKSKKSDVTLQYVMLHTFAFAVSALGLYAIYANKETNKPKDSKFYQGHLYSVHSWVGLCAALMFAVQWLSAVAAFVMPCLRNAGLPPGRTFSLYTVFVSSVALVTGINGHAIKVLRGAYRSYSTESLILNGFGMLIMVFVFLIAFMVLKPKTTIRIFVIEELENEEIQEGSLTDVKYIKLFSAYIYTNELCAAKFLWRRIPESIKTNQDLQKLWSIGNALWTKHYTQAFALIDCQWSDVLEPIMVAIKHRIQQDTLKLISMHYENIQLDKFQTLMGVNKEQAERIIESEGWTCTDGYVVPIAINEPEIGLSGSQEILDRLVTLSSFTSYIEN